MASKRNSSSPRCHNLKGQIIAKSHCLATNPHSFLIEIVGDSGAEYLIIREPEQFIWEEYLSLNKIYEFSDVCHRSIKIKDEKSSIWVSRKSTKWKTVKKTTNANDSDSHPSSPFFTISGEITFVDPFMSLVRLDDHFDIYIAYQQLCSLIPDLWKRQIVTFHNIHRMVLSCGKSIGVMCSRGYVEILRDANQQTDEVISQQVWSPLVGFVAHFQQGLGGLLWLKEEAELLCDIFPDSFLEENGLPRGDQPDFRELLIEHTAYLSFRTETKNSRSLLGEFMRSPHDCLPMKEFVSVPHSVSAEWVRNGRKESSIASQNIPSHCKTTYIVCSGASPLVGLLKPAKTQSYNGEASFCLLDGHHQVPCKIKHKGCIAEAGNLLKLWNSVIVARKYSIIKQRVTDSEKDAIWLCSVHLDMGDIAVTHTLNGTLNEVKCI